jgi:hypothetical protein
MQILKHGNLKSRKFTCSNCGCEFVADPTEYGTTVVKGIVLWCHAHCPECGCETSDSKSWENNDEQ